MSTSSASSTSSRTSQLSPAAPPFDGALVALVATAKAELAGIYDLPAHCVAAAPGRVNIIGEHTDYNDGFVLPMAINRHVVIAGAPVKDAGGGRGVAEVWSQALGEKVLLPLAGAALEPVPHWASYVHGVLAGFLERGIPVPAFKAVVVSDIPLGGGLSSSAALEVSTATFLEGLTGAVLSPQDKARLCRRAEHEYAGVPCGAMDQLASVMGQATGPLLIDCRDESVSAVRLADESTALLICNSNVKHSLGDGAYARRRAECSEAARILGVASLRDATAEQVAAAASELGPLLLKRARHVVSENARVLATAEALRAGDYVRAGTLLYASHRSLRDDYEVSVREIDLLVELAESLGIAGGVYGSRITGGGFGGCTVTLVDRERVDAVAKALAEGYARGTGRALTAFVGQPAQGAHLVASDVDPAPGGARRS